MKNSWEIYNDIMHVCVWLPRWLQFRRHRRWAFNPCIWKTPWRRKCNPLQYSCLENPMDRGAWQATVHGVAESDTTEWLIMHTCKCAYMCAWIQLYIYIYMHMYIHIYTILIQAHAYWYICTYKICIFYIEQHICIYYRKFSIFCTINFFPIYVHASRLLTER